MKFLPFLTSCLLASVLSVEAAAPQGPKQAETDVRKIESQSVVRVNSTNQNWDFVRPWQKRNPYERRGLGVVINGGHVIVTAELVGNNTYIELERAATAEKSPAEVVAVDYDANLALLKPTKEGFLQGTRPLELEPNLQVGDKVEILQLESNNEIAATPGTVTTITVAPYPSNEAAFLIYRVSIPLQYRENSFTVPVVHGDRLAGLLMRYNSKSQTADIIPAGIIKHFLKDHSLGEYQGFPRLGFSYSDMKDPQLRRYTKMPEETGGVYVTSVKRGSPAEKAGIEVGDIVLSIDGIDIDNDGNYEDAQYGRVPFSNLLTMSKFAGDSVKLRLLRNGEQQTLTAKLEAPDHTTRISEPYIMDRAPEYFILGGLLFQELSQNYLREWGGDWRKNAPQRLVYLDQFQDELPEDRGKVVFLGGVLPSDLTVGYERLRAIPVVKVNDKDIKSLEDLAEAVQNPIDGFHKIEFDEDPRLIYLDAEGAKQTNEAIKQQYGLPTLSRIDGQETED